MNKMIKLVDVNGNPISAQAAYDAAMSGLVYIDMSAIGSGYEGMYCVAQSFEAKKSGEEIVSVIFTTSVEGLFYAGAKPTGGAS